MEIKLIGLDDFMMKLEAIEQKLDKVSVTGNDHWISNDEFCSLLKICHKTAQSYRDKGLITFSQVGNKIHYKMSCINEFLDNHSRLRFRTMTNNI